MVFLIAPMERDSDLQGGAGSRLVPEATEIDNPVAPVSPRGNDQQGMPPTVPLKHQFFIVKHGDPSMRIPTLSFMLFPSSMKHQSSFSPAPVDRFFDSSWVPPCFFCFGWIWRNSFGPCFICCIICCFICCSIALIIFSNPA